MPVAQDAQTSTGTRIPSATRLLSTLTWLAWPVLDSMLRWKWLHSPNKNWIWTKDFFLPAMLLLLVAKPLFWLHPRKLAPAVQLQLLSLMKPSLDLAVRRMLSLKAPKEFCLPLSETGVVFCDVWVKNFLYVGFWHSNTYVLDGNPTFKQVEVHGRPVPTCPHNRSKAAFPL